MQSQQSRTQTQQNSSGQAVLHLRPASESTETIQQIQPQTETRPRVRWTTDVVDNENMNKKKSKICCIFHPQREFGESSDESDSSGSSDSSDSSDDEQNSHQHNGSPNNDDGDHENHSHHCCSKKQKKKQKKTKAATPNAYERQPQYKNKSTLPPSAI